jgi:putative ABC transport system permease protein
MLLALRYTLRSLARSRGFVAVAVLSLGISLGLASTTFAALDAVIHPYVPFTDPDRLFYVSQWGAGAAGTVTWHDKYLEVRDGARVHDEITLVGFQRAFVEGPNNVENTAISSVTDNFFDLLGVQPTEGRLFRSGQRDADEQMRVVISASLRGRLFKNPSLEGAALSMGGTTYEVIGVTPHGMQLPNRTDVWLLAPASVETSGTGSGAMFPVIRLRAGLDADAAKEQLARAADRLRDRFGVGRQDFGYNGAHFHPSLRVKAERRSSWGPPSTLTAIYPCGHTRCCGR